MSRLPSASPPYTTHLPSGDKLGNHSSPDCDVICVKVGCKSSRGAGLQCPGRPEPGSNQRDGHGDDSGRRSQPAFPTDIEEVFAKAIGSGGSTDGVVELETRIADVAETSARRPSRDIAAGGVGRLPASRPGAVVQSGSRSRIAADRVGDGLAIERLAAGEHLVEDAAERPDVGALVHRPAARLLRAHVGRRAENDAVLSAGPSVIVGEWARSGVAPSPSVLANPKSRTLTTPDGVTLTLAGLRSRWTMPLSCAAESASAI